MAQRNMWSNSKIQINVLTHNTVKCLGYHSIGLTRDLSIGSRSKVVMKLRCLLLNCLLIKTFTIVHPFANKANI